MLQGPGVSGVSRAVPGKESSMVIRSDVGWPVLCGAEGEFLGSKAVVRSVIYEVLGSEGREGKLIPNDRNQEMVLQMTMSA